MNRVQIVSARLPTSQSRRLSKNILAFSKNILVNGQNLNIDMDDTMSTDEEHEEHHLNRMVNKHEM